MSVALSFSAVQEKFNELQRDYSVLQSWRLTRDHAKRRAGVCYPLKKRIAISHYHIQLNSLSVIIDTLVHEVAHALAFELHNETGHGPHWRRWVTQLGGEAKVTGNFSVPETHWVLVHKQSDSLVQLARRHRKNKRIKDFILKGRPDTRGQLFYVSSAQFLAWQSGELLLSEVELIQ